MKKLLTSISTILYPSIASCNTAASFLSRGREDFKEVNKQTNKKLTTLSLLIIRPHGERSSKSPRERFNFWRRQQNFPLTASTWTEGALALRPHLGHLYCRLAQQQGCPSSPITMLCVPASLASGGRGPQCFEISTTDAWVGRNLAKELPSDDTPPLFFFLLWRTSHRASLRQRGSWACSPLQASSGRHPKLDLQAPRSALPRRAFVPARTRLHSKGFNPHQPRRPRGQCAPKTPSTPSRKAVRTSPPPLTRKDSNIRVLAGRPWTAHAPPRSLLLCHYQQFKETTAIIYHRGWWGRRKAVLPPLHGGIAFLCCEARRRRRRQQ